MDLGPGLGVAVVAEAKKDDPPRFSRSHGRLLTEDRQDDTQADRGAWQEAGIVFNDPLKGVKLTFG